MTAFCERPAVLIQNTSNCKKGSICCDNTRLVPTPKPRPAATQRPKPPPTFLPTTTSAPDYREECPGSCIVSLLSFTCFRKFISQCHMRCGIGSVRVNILYYAISTGNAEMTELFKCKKSGTICCAPKSRIQEVQGMMVRNDTFPVFVNPQQQHHQPPQYMPNNYPINNNYPSGIVGGVQPPLPTSGNNLQ